MDGERAVAGNIEGAKQIFRVILVVLRRGRAMQVLQVHFDSLRARRIAI